MRGSPESSQTCFKVSPNDTKLRVRVPKEPLERTGKLDRYVDSTHRNSVDYRSTSAYLFTLYGNAISGGSRKQTVVAQSSTEAEYVSMADAIKQALWVRHVLWRVKKPERGPTVMYEDNKGAISLSEKSSYRSKTKHIGPRYHAIRDAVANGDVRVEHKRSEDMIGDPLTKAIGRDPIKRMASAIGLIGIDLSRGGSVK